MKKIFFMSISMLIVFVLFGCGRSVKLDPSYSVDVIKEKKTLLIVSFADVKDLNYWKMNGRTPYSLSEDEKALVSQQILDMIQTENEKVKDKNKDKRLIIDKVISNTGGQLSLDLMTLRDKNTLDTNIIDYDYVLSVYIDCLVTTSVQGRQELHTLHSWKLIDAKRNSVPIRFKLFPEVEFLVYYKEMDITGLDDVFDFKKQLMYPKKFKSLINTLTDDFYSKYLGEDSYWDRIN